jgi:sugar lactone lactonase YvrE
MPEVQTLLTGLAFGESPRWHEDRLWFSNWGTQEVVAVDLEGKSEVMVRVPTTIPFSIDWLPDGRLLIVSGREGLLLRREPDGRLVTHVSLRSLSDRPWNEIVVDGRGNAYLNNICFDFLAGSAFAPGIIALLTPDGSARQVVDGPAFPNGMCFSPDNKTLIVAESFANRLTAFDIEADGICLDAEGAVWSANNKRCVRMCEGGEVLQTIPAMAYLPFLHFATFRS